MFPGHIDQENGDNDMETVLIRRFGIVVSAIALLGVVMASLVVNTRSDRGAVHVLDRQSQWQQHDCITSNRLCQISHQITRSAMV
jgi:hypothetical protein